MEKTGAEKTPAPSSQIPSSSDRKYQFTPHKKGTPLSGTAKTIVMNVLCKCKEQNPKDSDNDNTKRTSFLTGVSKTSIVRMINEYKTTGSLSTASKKRTRGKTTTRLERYDEATLAGIREIVNVYRQRNQYYSVKQVMNDIKDDPNLPTVSKKTTERLLKDLGITCAKKSAKSVSPRGVKKRKVATTATFCQQQANQTPSAQAHQTSSAQAHQTPSAQANQTPSAQANQTPSAQANQTPSSFLLHGPCRSLAASATLPIVAGYQPNGLYPPLPGNRGPADCRPMPDYAARWNYNPASRS